MKVHERVLLAYFIISVVVGEYSRRLYQSSKEQLDLWDNVWSRIYDVKKKKKRNTRRLYRIFMIITTPIIFLLLSIVAVGSNIKSKISLDIRPRDDKCLVWMEQFYLSIVTVLSYIHQIG